MRGKTISLVLSAAIAVCLTGVSAYGQDDGRFVKREVLKEIGLQYYWALTLPSLEKGEEVVHAYLLDENLYCMTNLNRVYAVDAARGLTLWSYKLADAKQTVFPPVSFDNVGLKEPADDQYGNGDKKIDRANVGSNRETSDDVTKNVKGSLGTAKPFNVVIFNTLDRLIILERSNGRCLANYPLGFSANTAGVTDGIFYFGGCTNGTLHCLRIVDGVKMWTMALDYIGDLPVKISELRTRLQNTQDETRKAELRNQISNLTAKMNKIVQKNPYDMITAPLAYYNGQVFIANETGQLIATAGNELKGIKKWQFMAFGSIVAPFVVDKRGCFIGSVDRHIYGLDAMSGTQLGGWSDGPFLCKGAITTPVLASKNSVFAYADKDSFYALDIMSGKLRWKNEDVRSIVANFDGNDYVVDKDNNLLAIESTTGAIKAKVAFPGIELKVANAAAPAMFVGTKDGKLFCINSVSAGSLTVEKLKK